MRRGLRIAATVLTRFLEDDSWAIASHMALSALTALFPFLIFVAALGGVLGTRGLRGEIVSLLFETWPGAVARPIAEEVDQVLSASRPGLLTLGAILSLGLATNGVEAVRIGLNRAYRQRESRGFWRCRLQGLAFVGVGAVGLVALGGFVVFWPALLRRLVHYAPPLAGIGLTIAVLHYVMAFLILGGAIVLAHVYLPAGHRGWREIWPGALLTFLLWFAGGQVFGLYLDDFDSYARLYAGLASVVAALFFLWLVSVAFLLGAELNAVLGEPDEPVRAPQAGDAAGAATSATSASAAAAATAASSISRRSARRREIS